MKSENGAKHLIFKTSIAVGLVLAIVLLCQTISTYIYVSGNMTVQAAQRDAEQKHVSMQRALRNEGVQETPVLDALLKDSIDEWKEQVAWIRVVDGGGRQIAAAGTTPNAEIIRVVRSNPDIRQTASGKALVASYPLVTLLLSLAFLRQERISLQLMAGVAGTVGGVVLLIIA